MSKQKRLLFVGPSDMEIGKIIVSFANGGNAQEIRGAVEPKEERIIACDSHPAVSACFINDIKDLREDVDLHLIVFSYEKLECVVEWHNAITTKCGQSTPIILLSNNDPDQPPSSTIDPDRPDEKSVTIMSEALGVAALLDLTMKKKVLSREMEAVWAKIADVLKLIEEYSFKPKIHLSKKGLVMFPQYLVNSDVTELNVSHNKISEMSCKQLNHPSFYNILKINLSHNNLSFISPLIGRLKNLKHLDLSYNKLTALPGSVADCSELTTLKLRCNLLDSLPPQLHHLCKISKFDIRENPLGAMLPEVIPTGGMIKVMDPSCITANRLWKYLQALETGKTTLFSRLKVMFVGDANVGKTSLLKCMQLNKPIGIVEHSVATDGIDLKEVLSGDVTLDCWDFAGQELYYTTHQFVC